MQPVPPRWLQRCSSVCRTCSTSLIAQNPEDIITRKGMIVILQRKHDILTVIEMLAECQSRILPCLSVSHLRSTRYGMKFRNQRKLFTSSWSGLVDGCHYRSMSNLFSSKFRSNMNIYSHSIWIRSRISLLKNNKPIAMFTGSHRSFICRIIYALRKHNYSWYSLSEYSINTYEQLSIEEMNNGASPAPEQLRQNAFAEAAMNKGKTPVSQGFEKFMSCLIKIMIESQKQHESPLVGCILGNLSENVKFMSLLDFDWKSIKVVVCGFSKSGLLLQVLKSLNSISLRGWKELFPLIKTIWNLIISPSRYDLKFWLQIASFCYKMKNERLNFWYNNAFLYLFWFDFVVLNDSSFKEPGINANKKLAQVIIHSHISFICLWNSYLKMRKFVYMASLDSKKFMFRFLYLTNCDQLSCFWFYLVFFLVLIYVIIGWCNPCVKKNMALGYLWFHSPSVSWVEIGDYSLSYTDCITCKSVVQWFLDRILVKYWMFGPKDEHPSENRHIIKCNLNLNLYMGFMSTVYLPISNRFMNQQAFDHYLEPGINADTKSAKVWYFWLYLVIFLVLIYAIIGWCNCLNTNCKFESVLYISTVNQMQTIVRFNFLSFLNIDWIIGVFVCPAFPQDVLVILLLIRGCREKQVERNKSSDQRTMTKTWIK